MTLPDAVLSLPDWVDPFLADCPPTLPTIEDRMQLAITLSKLNVENKTGGPFGAAIFQRDTGRLVSVGVNRVESLNCSLAHAETLAIAIAQKTVGSYDLSAGGVAHELATSTEPCVMCLGAICWSGLAAVVCAARDEDARRIGFDEGPKPKDWSAELQARNITVTKDILRDNAAAVLNDYAATGVRNNSGAFK